MTTENPEGPTAPVDEPFRRLVEAAPDGIVISRNGMMLYVNPAAVALLGYDHASELVGRPMTFLGPEGGAMMRRRLEEMARTGERLPPAEYPATRRDGTRIVAEIASMHTHYEGAPAVLAFARDVTERVRLREHLAHTDRLAAIGTLAAGVAHEINNPLTFMMLASELLQRNAADPAKVATAVRDIQAGATRIAHIVRDLREFARKDDDVPGLVDLATVIDSAARIVAHEVRPRARLQIDGTDGLPAVLGVTTRLEQVFVNLLLNASHAVPWEKRDAVISVTARATDDHVVIDVTDDGEGISPDVLPRIFDAYFTTKQATGGTGLGLSISREIVGRLGGTLEVESLVGRGTTMRLTLPIAATSPRSEPSPEPAPPSSTRRRVLVIDDEPMIVSTVLGILSPGHDVAGETDPRVGLERIASGEDFDVVLCDLMMPGLSGMDVYERVATERPGFERRFVFVTAGAYTEPTRAFLAAVPNARVMKPFTSDELARAIG